MATSIHVPAPLLAKVDARAKRASLSRNRFIVRALEEAVARDTEWSPGFFDRLRKVSAEDAAAFDESMRAVKRARRNKPPPRL